MVSAASAAGSPEFATTYRLLRAAPPPVAAPALDDAQRAVVAHAGGPLLVLAGPGTGKTTTLVEAVVDRVERGLSPEQVLVLTFSRKAAEELRGRITARLGRTVTAPAASTFHAWCSALVRHYVPDPPRLLSEPEREVRLADLLLGNADGIGTRWPPSVAQALRVRGFAREVADLLDRARERGLSGVALSRLGRAEGRPEWVAAGEFLEEYLDVLDARGEVDYAGLVALATAVLSRPATLAEVRDRYRAVFVDEYQDTDPSQERLLRLVAGDGRDLVVVGDPDQSIYAFRGADVSAILEFPARFPTLEGRPAPQLALGVSRRFSAATHAPARLLAERIPTPGLAASLRLAHRAVRPVGPDGPAPELRLYPTVADEVTAVADLLRRAHLLDGVPWRAMAVLVRSGVRSIPVLRRAFAMSGVPVTVATDEVPVARDPAVAPLLLALRLAHRRAHASDTKDPAAPDPLAPEEAEHLLLSPLGRALPSGLRLLGRSLRELDRSSGTAFPRPSAELVRDALLDGRDLSTVEEWAAAPVRRLAALLDAAAAVLAGGGTPEDALWSLWDGSGWGRRLEHDALGTGTAARQADRDLDAILALFQAAARLEERRPRGGVPALLDELENQRIPAAPTEERAAADDAVRLLTAHRSKGLEWDVVVVSGVQEGVWPDLRQRSSLLGADVVAPRPREAPTTGSLLAEERRLLYVALTRARRRLVVTAVESLDDSGERPSRFLDELGLPPLRGRARAGEPGSGGTGPDGTLSIGSLVARLRRAATDDTASPALRAAAARHLARLATARGGDGAALVPAAHPDTWWGLRGATEGTGPLHPRDEPLPLSASAVAAHVRCPLRWFLEREVGATSGSDAARGFGLVLHAVVRLVSDGLLVPDLDALLARLDTVWPSLGFEAAWHGEHERREAEAALRRFLAWHAARDRHVAGSEAEFRVQVGDVVLRGSADRVEVDADGAVHVVDFKTGRTARSAADLAGDPQLGVYQLAARAGAFADAVGEEAPLGGAELVWLRNERKGGVPQVQRQEALPPGEDTWADTMMSGVADSVRDERYAARPDDDCDRCPVRGACPAHPAGGQVVE
ncbi:MAG TPA: ATP-dependent DNA helicase [Mycobacteriales bacterium]|jgi:superfamily I DNA/RNA helicase/RecB family exonuclease